MSRFLRGIRRRIEDLENSGHGKKKVIVVGLQEDEMDDQAKCDERAAQLVKEAKAEGYHDEDIVIVQMWEPDEPQGLGGDENEG